MRIGISSQILKFDTQLTVNVSKKASEGGVKNQIFEDEWQIKDNFNEKSSLGLQ